MATKKAAKKAKQKSKQKPKSQRAKKARDKRPGQAAPATPWDALQPHERLALVGLALDVYPMTRSTWASWLGALGVRGPSPAPGAGKGAGVGGRKPSAADLQAMLAGQAFGAFVVSITDRTPRYSIAPPALHRVLSSAEAEPLLRRVLARGEPPTTPQRGYQSDSVLQDLFYAGAAAARAALFLGEQAAFRRVYDFACECNRRSYESHPQPLLAILHPQVPLETIELLPMDLRRQYHAQAIGWAAENAAYLDPALLASVVDDGSAPIDQRAAAVCVAALAGGPPAAVTKLQPADGPAALQALAVAALHAGKPDDARDLVRAAVQASRGPKRTRKPWLDGPLSPLLTLVLATGDTEDRALAGVLVDRAHRKRDTRIAYGPVKLLLQGRHPATAPDEIGEGWQALLMGGLVACYLGGAEGTDPGLLTLEIDELSTLAARRQRTGMVWLSQQLLGVAAALGGPPVEGNAGLLAGLAKPLPPWQRALERLQALAAQSGPSDATGQSAQAEGPRQRLVFLLKHFGTAASSARRGPILDVDAPAFGRFVESFYGSRSMPADLVDELREDLRGIPVEESDLSKALMALAKELSLLIDPADDDTTDGVADTPNLLPVQISPRIQTRNKRGYSRGKAVALRRLAEDTDSIEGVTEHDRRVAATISARRDWYGQRDYFFGPRALSALAGHPHIYADDAPDGPPLRLVRGEFALRVVHAQAGLRLRLSPQPDQDGMALHEDAQGRLAYCELSAPQRQVWAALGHLPAVPAEGRAALDATLAQLSALFPIHAQQQLGVGSARELPADARPTVLLQRVDPGLALRVVAMPLGPDGPTLTVGEGAPAVTCQLDGQATRCTRDLPAEAAALHAVAAEVPELLGTSGGHAHRLEELGPCLRLLQGLRALGDRVHLRWTQGAPIDVLDEADTGALNLRLQDKQQWLEVDGGLRVDEAQVLSLSALLSARAVDGFVALGEDRYLPLSDDLSSQLSALRAAAAPQPRTRAKTKTKASDGDGEHTEQDASLRLPPAALGFVSPWLRKLRADALKLNARARKRVQAIDRAMDATPELPRTLEASLRPYQRQGYDFLWRLSQVQAGAALADDMGLGKTLMTLALLLDRAPSGPALVVAPVSVKRNWVDEALRFAPTLRVRSLDRAEDIETASDVGAFDVVLCSYAVMTLQADALSRTRWSTLVLDEAQAIKNLDTQRARAARKLVADARIALTGTPVENNLGDMYSLMSFLNPGLLGSAAQFKARFGTPIQRDGDAAAARDLRSLIAPFVLRRRKAEVLRELPPKTEVVVEVEPGEQERAFVEALRRDALQRLQRDSTAGGAVTILAEITRLRRAACHPTLADAAAGAQVGAAKLERLLELLQELKAGGHRALVFSQFVDFLKIVGEALQKHDISYQYLDGSTGEQRRAAAVRAFQAGEGDAFLISLKAGGFGLNLTAADYVIHLDPWWNPAVEAQASDRAHRIGQQRPVTVYKLVNAGSVEERVLSLHARKRELAEDLLRDTADAPRLDTGVLMSLLE